MHLKLKIKNCYIFLHKFSHALSFYLFYIKFKIFTNVNLRTGTEPARFRSPSVESFS